MSLSTGDATSGKGGAISLLVGQGDTGAGGDMSLIAGTTTSALGNGGSINIIAGSNEVFNSDLYSTTDGSGVGGELFLSGGSSQRSNGGSVSISSGESVGGASSSGNVSILSASARMSGASGGVNIGSGGSLSGGSGMVLFSSGNVENGESGKLLFSTGHSTYDSAGDILLKGGKGFVSGGSLHLEGGSSENGVGGSLSLSPGNGNTNGIIEMLDASKVARVRISDEETFLSTSDHTSTISMKLGIKLNSEESISLFSPSLGVGIDKPLHKLHVIGNTFVEGNIRSTQNGQFDGKLRVGQDDDVNAENYALYVAGSSFVSGLASFRSDVKVLSNLESKSINIAENAHVGSDLVVKGSVQVSESFNVLKDATFQSAIHAKSTLDVAEYSIFSGDAEFKTNIDVLGKVQASTLQVLGSTYVQEDIHVQGRIFGTLFSTSDARLKRDIKKVDSESCANLIKKLNLYDYKWAKQYTSETGVPISHVERGVLAQELQKIIPSAVSTESDSRYGVQNVLRINTNIITMNLVGCTQHLLKENEKFHISLEQVQKQLLEMEERLKNVEKLTNTS
jgi:hypothetical protein